MISLPSCIGSLNCIFKRRLYKARISYLPCDSGSNEQLTHAQEGEISHSCSQFCQEKVVSSTKKKISEAVGTHKGKAVNVDVTMANAATEQSDAKETNHPTPLKPSQVQNEKSYPQNPNSQNSATTESPTSDRNVVSEPSRMSFVQNKPIIHQLGPQADLLPPISGPVPRHWETTEGEFISVIPSMIPFLSQQFFSDPDVPIGSGKIHIVTCDNQISRFGMLGVMTKASTGRYLEMDGVERKDVKAFRLEPLTTPGMLTIDGEEVKYGPLQCQVHPRLARVMCRKRQNS